MRTAASFFSVEVTTLRPRRLRRSITVALGVAVVSLGASAEARDRPLVAVLADPAGTETTDMIAPYAILAESGAVDVEIVIPGQPSRRVSASYQFQSRANTRTPEARLTNIDIFRKAASTAGSFQPTKTKASRSRPTFSGLTAAWKPEMISFRISRLMRSLICRVT